MNKRTRIAALAAVLAVIAASAPLWAQSGEWPAWEGKNNADKKEWDEMGACWTALRDAYRFLDNINVRAVGDKRYADDVSRSAGAAKSAASELGAYENKQKDGVKFWKKEKARFQAVLTKAQQVQRPLLAQIEAAEQAEKKAAEERQAAIARGVTEEDFTVDVTQDGKGVIITGYKGAATEVKIPAAIQGMPVRVISGFSRSSITSVVIPEGVTAIDRQAFSGYKQLAQVTLPSTLKVIEEGAFSGTALKAVVIPRGITEISSSTFSGCTSLATVTIPNSVTKIGGGTFSGCTSLASITIPNSVTEIGGGTFRDCTSLTTITIPGSVTTIGDFAFEDCTSLTSVTIPNSVTRIGTDQGRVFSGCTSLASITIPNSVTRIDFGTFFGCTSLATVTISPVQGRSWHDSVFSCPKLSLASQAALRAAGYTGRFNY